MHPAIVDLYTLRSLLAVAVTIAVAITITVAIAVAITVAIAITAITLMDKRHIREDDSHILEAALVGHLLDERQRVLVQAAHAHDVRREVGDTVDDSCVGNNLSGCGVEDDIVVMLAEIIYQSVEFLAHEQLSGVRRSLLAYDIVKAG